jgi:hypothetical protein
LSVVIARIVDDGSSAALSTIRPVCLRKTKTRSAGCPATDRLRACGIDREYRKGTKPSDHAPLLLDLAGAGH